MNKKDFKWIEDGEDFLLMLCGVPIVKVEHFIGGYPRDTDRYCGVFADESETDGYASPCTAKRYVEKKFGLKITKPYHKGKK